MTEQSIFEHLLTKQYDFPKLHSEAADSIAHNLTEMITNSLKFKSAGSTSKRLDILKFLKNLSQTSNTHHTVQQYNCDNFIEKIENSVFHELDETKQLINKINEEVLIHKFGDLKTDIQLFYRRKCEKQGNKNKRLEHIQKYDQKALENANLSVKTSKKIGSVKSHENLLNLIPSLEETSTNTSNFLLLEFREKQIKFAYALTYLKKWGTLDVVLKKLSQYKELSIIEVNFLIYLNDVCDERVAIRQFLAQHFMFIFEHVIIEICTQLIQEDATAVDGFLLNSDNVKIIKHLSCDVRFASKVKLMIIQLYRLSCCNDNILKFMDFIFK